MRVIVNAGLLAPHYPDEYLEFISEIIERMARLHPEHSFVIVCDRSNAGIFKSRDNLTIHQLKHFGISPLLWKYWYDLRLPVILRKYKADIVLSTSGFCSMTTKLPQCMILQDLAILHFPASFSRARRIFHKRFTGKLISKAKRIVTLSEFSRQDIVKNYKTDATKIDTIYNGVSELFKPATGEIKDQVKEKYTGGKDFFLYSGSLQPAKNAINLLKAFSLFKKRQQSGLKLILCAKTGAITGSLAKNLETYKYRSDVVLLQPINNDELSRLTATAYALVHPVVFDAFCSPLLQALQCRVPVITTGGNALQEIAGPAALYAPADNYKELAEQLMRLYKDENLRNELIKNGETVAAQHHHFTWDNAAELLWQSLLKTL